MVLPFSSKTNPTPEPVNEPPRILTEDEQLLLAVDQGTHEVKLSIFTIDEFLLLPVFANILFRHAWMVNPFD